MRKKLEKKLKGVERCGPAEEEEKDIVIELMQDTNKCFNNDNNAYDNQQLIGCRDLFRGVIVKEWVVSNQKQIDL